MAVKPKNASCFVNALAITHSASGEGKNAGTVTKYTHVGMVSRKIQPANTKEIDWFARTVLCDLPVTDAVIAPLASQGRIVMSAHQDTILPAVQ